MRWVRGAAALALAATAWGGAASAATAPPIPRVGPGSWWFTSLGLAEAHRQVTGKGVTVGLIDGPVASEVPELKGRDVVPVVNVCGGSATGTGAIADHTTALAAAIVGSGKGNSDDGVGTLGIAPDASLRVYAVGDAEETVGCGRSGVDGAALAFDRAVADGVRVVGYAGGSERLRPTLAAAVKRALDAGIVVVAATGDSRDRTVLNPAAIPGVVAVSATTSDAEPWRDNVAANREAFVISAPGVDLPMGGFFDGQWRSAALRTGTSEATALVAGGVALAMQRWPNATGNQILTNLIRTATKSPTASPSPAGRDSGLGFGVMSVSGMLASDPAQWPDANPLLPAPTPTPTASPAPFVAKDAPEQALGWPVIAGALLGTTVFVATFVFVRVKPRRRQTPTHREGQ
ncbi:MAG: S8 family serine peptidase [Sporichthyaceae bacterium]